MLRQVGVCLRQWRFCFDSLFVSAMPLQASLGSGTNVASTWVLHVQRGQALQKWQQHQPC
jgi:hypothetical protein